MDASLDVFAILGENNVLWIGCAEAGNEAIELMRTHGLNKADRFFTPSQRTGRRAFYVAGQDSNIIQLEQHSASW